MSRRWLITVSLVVHAGIGVGMFVTNVWQLDLLDYDRKSAIGLAVMMPPSPPPEGGHEAKGAPAPTLVPKRPKEVAKDLTQRRPKPPEAIVAAVASSSSTDGEGEGDGDGDGSASGEGIKDGVTCDGVPCSDVPAPMCGNRTVETGESCDDGNRTGGDGCSATCAAEPRKQTIVPPSVFVGLRLTGETQIHPPATVKTAIQRDGRDRVLGTVKLCIDTGGRVASATMSASTKYPGYDAVLLASVRAWRYRPFAVNGTAMSACSTVTFVFSMR